MLAFPGLSRACVGRGIFYQVHCGGNSKWGLVIRSCSTQQLSKSATKSTKSAPRTAFQAPFGTGLEALIAFSSSGKIVGKDSEGNLVVKDSPDPPVEISKVPMSSKEQILKEVRSTKVKKAPSPEPKFSKAARRFFNMRFRKPERLSKVMAAAGVASRRACEEIIFAGKVVVNGKVCKTPETHVDPLKDIIYINGKSIPRRLPPKMVFALYKPKGYICSDSKDDTRTVNLLFEKFLQTWAKNNPGITRPRLFTVGRLDVATTGLMFVTNDGEFAQKVSHPSSGITKEYIVTVGEKVTRKQFRRVADGTEVDGAMCVPISVELLNAEPGDSKQRLRVVVSEGRHHEVRKLVENAFLQVTALKRVRIGGLRLPSKLSTGKYIQLTEAQMKQVTEQDPVLLESGNIPLVSGTDDGTSNTALVESKEPKERNKYPLLTERKEIQAVIESSSMRPLMLEQVKKMVVNPKSKNPARRVRPLVFK